MRSQEHREWYRVGRTPAGIVYWHPMLGLALEADKHLIELPEEERNRITWFDDQGSLETLEVDVRANPELLDAMPDDLVAAYEDAIFGSARKGPGKRVG